MSATIANLIESLGVSMTCTEVRENPHMDSPMKGGSHWSCILKREGREMQVYFSQGAAYRRWVERGARISHPRYANSVNRPVAPHDIRSKFPPVRGTFEKETVDLRDYRATCTEPIPPTVDNVLSCLASDAQGYDNTRNFEDWCADYGMDTDSRKAERSYRTIGEQAKALRHFMGADYDALLACEPL